MAKETTQKNPEVESEKTSVELQKQIEALNKQIESQKTLDASKRLEEARKQKEEQESKLMQEADIKKALHKEGVDIDDLTPSELLSIVGDAFEQAIDAKATLAIQSGDEKVSQLHDKLTKIENYLISKEASEGVRSARSKFKDFDDYKEDISKLFEQYPGISPTDAYVLAKSRKAGDVPPKSQMDSERPDNAVTRTEQFSTVKRNVDSSNDDSAVKTRRQLRELISSGVEKAIAARSSKGM